MSSHVTSLGHGRRLGGIFVHDFGDAATRADECHDALVAVAVYLMAVQGSRK